MMKKLSALVVSLLSCLGLSGMNQAAAQDSTFDREFAKFDQDFERLGRWKTDTPASKKMKHKPATVLPPSESGTLPLDDAVPPAAKVSENDAGKGLPAGAKVEALARSDLLGNQISDPVMRKKVQDLYRRDDVVVQQYVLPTN